MTDLNKATRILKEHKTKLEEEYGLSEIGVFGSYVEGRQTEDSDLDILVEFGETIDLFSFVRLKNYLSDLLGTKVDLVMKKALKPKIGERILSQVIYI